MSADMSASNGQNEVEALVGDPRRRASAAERGFIYQFWRTVEAWSELGPDEALFVEGAEDLDVVGHDEATAVQIKDNRASGALTLSSENALSAINNYWDLRERNARRRIDIRYQYVTTAAIGVEQDGFNGEKGIELWQSCRSVPARDAAPTIERLRKFLLAKQSIRAPLAAFLRTATTERIHGNLILPIEWLANEPSLGEVRDRVLRLLMSLTGPHGIPSQEVPKIASELYQIVEAVAIDGARRSLSQRELFEQISRFAYVVVPRSAMALQQFVGHYFSKTGAEEFPSLSSNESRFAPPILPGDLLLREKLIESVRATLRKFGIVHVDGGTGMGKTTLVRQVVDGCTPLLWADLREPDLRERGGRYLPSLLHEMRVASLECEHAPCVVLDDFNCQTDPRLIEGELGRLAKLVRDRRGTLVIISYRPIVPRLASVIGLSPEAALHIPPFDEHEIQVLMESLGCNNARRAKALSRIVWMQTSGHPQLVAVHVTALKSAGFPEPALQDVIEHPKVVEDSRAEALQLIRSVLNEPARDLLYRLSLTIGAFRRSVALRIAEIDPVVPRSGEVLNELVGPWLEQPAEGYLRVSPLVSKAGQQVLSQEEMRRLHRQIAATLIAEKSISVAEFSSAVFHAIIGRAEKLAVSLFYVFSTAPRDVKRAIANDCDWVLAISSKIDDELPFTALSARRSFRLLQWEIAAIARPKQLQSLKHIVDREFSAKPEGMAEIMSWVLYASTVLMRVEIVVPVGEYVDKAIEFSRLIEWVNRQEPSLGIGMGLPMRVFGREKATVLDWFSSVLAQRVRGPEEIRALVRAIDALGDEERNMFLATFRSDDGDTRLLFSKAWLGLSQEDAAGHEASVQILREALVAGRRWECRPWMQAVARSLSVILDERLGLRSEAEKVVADVVEEAGSSFGLNDQLAIIAFNRGDYSRALEIWRNVIPAWVVDEFYDVQPVFSARSAAIAAGCLGLWNEAGELFGQAAHRSERFKKNVLTLGLRADCAYMLWRAGQRMRALDVLSAVVEQLEVLPNTPESFKEYALHKFVGQVLLYLSGNVSSGEPSPGMCSQFEPHKDIARIPVTPVAAQWWMIFRVASSIGSVGLKERASRKVLDAPYAHMRFEVRLECLQAIIAAGLIEDVFDYAVALARDAEFVGARRHRPVYEPDCAGSAVEIGPDVTVQLVVPALMGAIINARASGQAIIQFFDAWRQKISSLGESVRSAVEELISVGHLGERELVLVLQDAGLPVVRRTMAGVLLLGIGGIGPEEALYAHLRVFDAAIASPILQKSVAISFDRVIRNDWLRLANAPFLLRDPRLHVESIRAACNLSAVGWSTAAKVILAAIPAVRLGVPVELIQKLQKVAASA
ncbi:hypothetical protein [Archangium sp. Cb G35]|uniref:hypothetical protein n=1 Tax=Archangium sp. Cb G35 TaxID=1920190 RepID=UPI001160EEFB|nr:hypothetical protein [Archangium sp. Cb G35]